MLAVWLKSWVAGHGLPYLRLAALGISVVAFAWLLRRPASTQLGLLIAGTVFGIGLLMFETVLEVRGLVPEARSEYSYVWKRQRCAAAVAAGEPFDGRSALDFLDDIRRTRPDMSIVVQPMTIAHAWPERSETLLPLGTLPERTALYCNEDGTWRLRSPDEHGFMNPRGLYRVGAADLLLLGDSYVAGFCVEEDQTVGRRSRRALSTSAREDRA